MNTGVVNQFLDVFTRYIDSGFGLLSGEVAFLSSTLVVIDVTLAALFWAWSSGEDVLARLIKKTLYVGFFAFLIGNFSMLAGLIFESFAGLGLQASGGAMSSADFLQPGRLAQTGIDAGRPILEAAGELTGVVALFENFIQIIVLLAAWLVVVVAFFVLSVQLFVTLIEFKLTTLAGFVLVPFGLFGKTAFLAERVLGNVVASGVKVLVLAVIVGIGSTLFDTFVQDFGGAQPTLEEVLALALGAVSLLGLGIFGPGIATGLVSGAPQLGAGAAVGTGLAVGGMAAAGVAAGRAATGAAAGLVRRRPAQNTSRPGPSGSGDPGLRPSSPSSAKPAPTSSTGGGATAEPKAPLTPTSAAVAAGGSGATPQDPQSDDREPAWAKRIRRGQSFGQAVSATAHAIRSGDHGGGSTSVPLSEDK